MIENGTQTWVEEEPIYDGQKKGGSAYTWHPDGNKVRVARILHERTHRPFPQKPGASTRRLLGYAWRNFQSLF